MRSRKQLKNKLQATLGIRQITRAMEMVAATKMRRAEETALASRPYAKKALALLRNLLSTVQKEDLVSHSHYFKRSIDGPVCLVVVTSDRGLAGSFNANVLRQAESFLAQHPSSDVVAVGKKAQDFFKVRGAAASFADFSDIATLPEIAPLADWLLSRYENHTYDSIVFCSTNFVSALSQKVEHTDVLPLTVEGLLSIIERIVPKTGRYSGLQNGEEKETPFALFEPSATEVFEAIVPELVRVEILHLMFESAASEHASRMVAMKAATESADDIISELGLELNKARQAGITQELAEISTAKEALSHE